jgi:hypothetical protein
MATYRPDHAARWLAAVRGRVVLMVPATAAPDLAALWPELTADDPTSMVLDRLTGGGLSATPPFALVVRAAGSSRIVVRGDLVVSADGIDSSGSGIATWTERVVESAEVCIEAPGDGDDTDAANDVFHTPELPVVEAIVPARAVVSAAVEVVSDEPSSVYMPPTASVPVPTPPAQVASVPPEVSTPVEAPVPPAAPAPGAAEQTIVPIEDTIVTPVSRGPSTATGTLTTPLLEGDHDGLTVASIDIRRLREQRAARSSEGSLPMGVPGVAAAVPESPRSSLRMPDGSVEPIAHEVVLGRAPSVAQVSGGRLPRLITVGAGDPDISRNHLRITLEGDTVVVTDLHSRNGTHVVAPGKAPVKLRAGEPTPVLAGTVVDLGGGTTLQVVGA